MRQSSTVNTTTSTKDSNGDGDSGEPYAYGEESPKDSTAQVSVRKLRCLEWMPPFASRSPLQEIVDLKEGKN